MASDLDLPALRAVIEAVRGTIAMNQPALFIACHRADLITLASACERLAEENERVRGLLAESLAEIHRAASIHADKILAITPAPAGKGEG